MLSLALSMLLPAQITMDSVDFDELRERVRKRYNSRALGRGSVTRGVMVHVLVASIFIGIGFWLGYRKGSGLKA
jgi:hypothetical protein